MEDNEELSRLLIEAISFIKDPKGVALSGIISYLKSKASRARFKYDENFAKSRKRELGESADDVRNKKQKISQNEDIDNLPNYSFFNLARDIAEEIFSYLSYLERIPLFRVSKGVNQLIKTKRLWQDLKFTDSSISPIGITQIVKIAGSQLNSIVVAPDIPVHVGDLLTTLNQTKPINLKRLEFTQARNWYVDNSLIDVFFETCPNIEHLMTAHFGCTSLPKLKNLKTAIIPENDGDAIKNQIIPQFPQLENVYFLSRYSTYPQIREKVLEHLKDLKSLTLNGNNNLLPLSSFINKIKNAEYLCFSHWRIPDDIIGRIFTEVPSLKTFICQQNQSNDIITIKAKIQKLDIGGLPQGVVIEAPELLYARIHMNVFKIILDCPKLKALYLHRLNAIPQNLFSMCPSITKLQLHCNDGLNFHHLEQLPLLEEFQVFSLTSSNEDSFKFVKQAKYLKKLILNGARVQRLVIESSSLNYLQMICSKCNYAKIKCPNLKMWDYSDAEVTEFLIDEETLCENLREFDFWTNRTFQPSNCSSFVFSNVRKWAPNLKILICSNLAVVNPVSINHENLTLLTLSKINFSGGLSINCPLLENLNLKGIQLTKGSLTLEVPNVNTLILDSIDSDLFLEKMASYSKLEVLSVLGCIRSKEKFHELLKAIPNIKSLKIGRKYQAYGSYEIIADEDLYQLAQSCKDLTSLKIHGCDLISDAALRNLVGACRSLSSLKIVACRKISSKATEKIESDFNVKVERFGVKDVKRKNRRFRFGRYLIPKPAVQDINNPVPELLNISKEYFNGTDPSPW